MKRSSIYIALILSLITSPSAASAQVDSAAFVEWTAPVLISPIALTYPEEAKAKRIEGKVTLSLKLDTNGLVEQVRVDRTDSELLNQAAIAAMRNARFTPAREAGKTVRIWYQQTLSFKLSASDTATTVTQLLKDSPPVPIVPLSQLFTYPPVAKAAGIEGSVTLQALIDTSGRVDSIYVLGVSAPLFEAAAVAAMNLATFSPAIERGVKVPALFRQTLSFQLPRGSGSGVVGLDASITAEPVPLRELPVIFSRSMAAPTLSTIRVLVAKDGLVVNALARDANANPETLATLLQAAYDLPFAPGMIHDVVSAMWTDITFTIMPLK